MVFPSPEKGNVTPAAAAIPPPPAVAIIAAEAIMRVLFRMFCP
jgi:hypothetical protein